MMTSLLAPNTRTIALKNVERLPSLSPAVNRLLGLLAKRDADIQLMGRVIASDPALSGHILSVANSALFSRGSNVKTVDQAITRIGIAKLRRIALSKSAARIFRGMKTPPEWSMTRFQLHSVAVGAAAELLCEYLEVEDAESAFLGGLMHDVGKVLIAIGQPDRFREIENLVSITGRSQVEFERDLLGTDHAELSGLAVAKWELPFPLSRAVSRHHDPDEAGEFGSVSLSQALKAADEFANSLAISVREQPSDAKPPVLPVIPGHEYPGAKFAEKFEAEWKLLSAVCF